jgi:hypothetical protein
MEIGIEPLAIPASWLGKKFSKVWEIQRSDGVYGF